MICVILVLCLILVPLPPGKNTAAAKINKKNNKTATSVSEKNTVSIFSTMKIGSEDSSAVFVINY
jgi:hypothetical protein